MLGVENHSVWTTTDTKANCVPQKARRSRGLVTFFLAAKRWLSSHPTARHRVLPVPDPGRNDFGQNRAPTNDVRAMQTRK
ncbi:hypothetical protein P8C59_007520 [Phyllachora maydis]|uniref:Uncharacterized protein n=1 Tax=Phyllachora maydis TaxID=1825666 RepID=A0AAD9I9Q0_9PEZI|nr:hypothetical protein P8C59_007520 [Phyllachora maydis]